MAPEGSAGIWSEVVVMGMALVCTLAGIDFWRPHSEAKRLRFRAACAAWLVSHRLGMSAFAAACFVVTTCYTGFALMAGAHPSTKVTVPFLVCAISLGWWSGTVADPEIARHNHPMLVPTPFRALIHALRVVSVARPFAYAVMFSARWIRISLGNPEYALDITLATWTMLLYASAAMFFRYGDFVALGEREKMSRAVQANNSRPFG